MTLKNLNEWLKLTESVNDKNILKAFIFGGGPGSGKSYIIRNLFPSYEVKVLNSDDIFTTYLDKHGISHKLNELPEEVYDFAVNVLRIDAKKAIEKISKGWLNSLFPIAVDGTGKNPIKITKQKNLLEYLGYDVYFIYVSTDLETTLKRNRERARTVPEDLVKQMWMQATESEKMHQKTFGDKFIEIDNNGKISKEKETEIYRLGKRLLESPLENPIGNDLITRLQEKGLKYRFDLDKDEYTIPI